MKQCLAPTKKFERCQNPPQRGSLFCRTHRWWWLAGLATAITGLATVMTVLASFSQMFGVTFPLPFVSATPRPTLTATPTPTPTATNTSTPKPTEAVSSQSLGTADPTAIAVEPISEKICIVVEKSGANVFDEPVMIAVNLYARLSLPPGSKVYVVGEVNSVTIPLYEISKMETDLGTEGVELGPVTVTAIMPNSPADHVGMQSGDIIVEIDGITVDNQDFFRQYIAERPGIGISIKLERAGRIITVDVTPAIIEGISKIGVALEGGRPTGLAIVPYHGYVPQFAVDCTP